MARALLSLGAALVLSACATAPGVRADRIELVPDTGGLAIAGSALRFDFARSPEGMIAALERAVGRPEILGLTGCGPEIRQQIAWADLVLTFTDERFVGWRQGEARAGQTCAA